MNIKRWTSNKKVYKIRRRINGGNIMEMKIKKTRYKKANDTKVLNAINKCTKKYGKALNNLAK